MWDIKFFLLRCCNRYWFSPLFREETAERASASLWCLRWKIERKPNPPRVLSFGANPSTGATMRMERQSQSRATTMEAFENNAQNLGNIRLATDTAEIRKKQHLSSSFLFLFFFSICFHPFFLNEIRCESCQRVSMVTPPCIRQY